MSKEPTPPKILLPTEEGFVPFTYQGEAYQTYYKVFGSLAGRTATPVLVLHGGPGLSHDYVLPHADLADHRPVIFYDQIGNGRSTRLPAKPSAFWSVDLFLTELENLVARLGVQDAFHVVGHSWGGMMAAELASRRRAAGLRRLVIANSPAAYSLWTESLTALLRAFPEDVTGALARGENADLKAYREAIMKVYAVHGLRIQPFPEEFMATMEYRYGDDADRTVPNAGCVVRSLVYGLCGLTRVRL